MHARKMKPGCLVKPPREGKGGAMVESPRYTRAGRSLARLETPVFDEVYRVSCLEHRVDALGYVVEGWKQGKLCLSLDGLAPDGLLALSKALRRTQSFELETLKICHTTTAPPQKKPAPVGRSASVPRKAPPARKKPFMGGSGGGATPRTKRPLDASLVDLLFQGLQHHLASLRRLEITNVPLSKTACLALIKGMPACRRLEYFSLSGCLIGDAAFVELAPVLQRLPSLVTLDVAGCDLSDRGGELLKSIILAHQERRKDIAFKRSLRSSSPVKIERGVGLEHIVASGNRLGDGTCTALVSALHYDDFVLTLQLSHNRITPHGAACLNRLVDYNTTLAFIDISDNLDASALLQAVEPAQRHFMSHGPGSCIFIGDIKGDVTDSMRRTMPVAVGGGPKRTARRAERDRERQSNGHSPPHSHCIASADLDEGDDPVGYANGARKAAARGRQMVSLPSTSSQEQVHARGTPPHRRHPTSSRDDLTAMPIEARVDDELGRTDSYEDTPTTPKDERCRHKRSRRQQASPRHGLPLADGHETYTTENPLATLTALYGNVEEGLRVTKLNHLLKADLAVRKQYHIPQPGISGLSSVVKQLSKTYKDVIPWAEFKRHVRRSEGHASGVERASLLKILHKMQRMSPEQHEKILQRIYDGPEVVAAGVVDQYLEECHSDNSTNPSSSSSPAWGAGSCRDVACYPHVHAAHGHLSPHTSVPTDDYARAPSHPPPPHVNAHHHHHPPPPPPPHAAYSMCAHPSQPSHPSQVPVCQHGYPVVAHMPPPPPPHDPYAVAHHQHQLHLLGQKPPAPAQAPDATAARDLGDAPKADALATLPDADAAKQQLQLQPQPQLQQPMFAWEGSPPQQAEAHAAREARDAHTEKELKRIEHKLDSLMHTMQPTTLLVEKIQELLSRGPSQSPAAAGHDRGNGFAGAKAAARADEEEGATVTSEEGEEDSSPEYQAIYQRLMERYPGADE